MAQKLREVDAENRRLIQYLSEIQYIVSNNLDIDTDKLNKVLRIVIKWQAEG